MSPSCDDGTRRREIGVANRQRAERLFSVEAMVASYAALYQELIPRTIRLTAEAST